MTQQVPGIIPHARFAEDPLPPDREKDRIGRRRRQLQEARAKSRPGGLGGPTLPPALKRRRTRHVNADPEVKASRAAAVAALANTYPDPMAAVRAMERRLFGGAVAPDLARNAGLNPEKFGAWYGAERPEASPHHRPDREILAPALGRLAEALDAAGREAARRMPTSTPVRRPRAPEDAQPSVGRSPVRSEGR